MNCIRWGSAARVSVEGLSAEEVRGVAGRWCGYVESDRGADHRLRVPPLHEVVQSSNPRRVRIGVRGGAGDRPLALTVGPHTVELGSGDEPNVVRHSARRSPSAIEHELLIDVGINHLLARQGLPVIHGCAFELGGASILGLGESFSGKTTVSVAALRAGGRVASDDVVLAVPEGNGLFSLFPVRSYGWLRGRTREIVPYELQHKMFENEEDGSPRWVLNRDDCGESFVEEVVPGVVWVQSVDRRLKASRVEPVDQGQVFAALIRASSPLYLSRHCPEIRDKLIPVFRSLCAQCRGYRVRLGRRLLEDPEGEMARLLELSR